MSITKGVVVAFNSRLERYAVQTENDGITIIEKTHNCDIDIGDEFTWTSGKSMGGWEYQNVTKNKSISVYVQNHCVSRLNLKAQLGLK